MAGLFGKKRLSIEQVPPLGAYWAAKEITSMPDTDAGLVAALGRSVSAHDGCTEADWPAEALAVILGAQRVAIGAHPKLVSQVDDLSSATALELLGQYGPERAQLYAEVIQRRAPSYMQSYQATSTGRRLMPRIDGIDDPADTLVVHTHFAETVIAFKGLLDGFRFS